MNIHEYQAKQLLKDHGVPVPNGYPATTTTEVDQAIAALDSEQAIVVKAQIHAGGRGKGTFTDGYQGGVKVVDGPEAALEAAGAMLGNTLVTAQTGPADARPDLYLTEACDIDHEYYLAVVLDRETAQAVIIASTEGGMDTEAVAEQTPTKLSAYPSPPPPDCAPTTAAALPLHSALPVSKSKPFPKSSPGCTASSGRKTPCSWRSTH